MSPSRKWLVVAVSVAAVGSFVAALRESAAVHSFPTSPVAAVTPPVAPDGRVTAPVTPKRTLTRTKPLRKKEVAAEFQLGSQIPVGWTAQRIANSADQETHVSFQVRDHPGISPSLHFHPFPTPVFFWSQDVRSWLGDIASAKEAQRRREGFLDYHNRLEMTPRVIGNRAALSWTADFTRNGEPWVENLTRVFSPSGTALFFVQAPAAEIQDIQPSFDIIIETSVLPTLAKSNEVASVY